MSSPWNQDSYFSIHQIYASEESVVCRFEQVLPGLGFLCLDSDTENIEPGTKLEVPFWFAQSFIKSRTPIARIDMPKIYKEHYREILDADACAVDLMKWNRHYYELGLAFQQSGIDPECKISEFLSTVFKSRFKLLISRSLLSALDSCPASENLTELESRIEERGKNAQTQLSKWLNFCKKNIETSSVIHNIRKRKQAEY